MATDIIIKSHLASATISTLGAEIKSFNDGKEYIWQADPTVWARSGPVLFPICGKLKNDTYYHDGKEYHLGNHGFSKDTEYEVFKRSDSSVTFLLRSNQATKSCYPFDFELFVTYELIDKKLCINYTVKNTGNCNMYFSVGGHEGYSCPEGVEAYTLTFDNDTVLCRHMVDDGMLTGETEAVELSNGIMTLKYDEFERGTYLFRELRSSSVVLSNGKDRSLKISFEEIPCLALWTLYDRKYLCIEPWCGFSQPNDFDGDIAKKDAINILPPQKDFSCTHTVEILA